MATNPEPRPDLISNSSAKPAVKPSNIVTAFEAKTRFGTLLRRVAEGEEIIITRHDKVVARIVPEEDNRRARSRRALENLRQLRERMAARQDFTPLSNEEILSAIAEGRR